MERQCPQHPWPGTAAQPEVEELIPYFTEVEELIPYCTFQGLPVKTPWAAEVCASHTFLELTEVREKKQKVFA